MACHPAVKETFHRDKVGIARETYGFLEESEDFLFSALLKSENSQDFISKLDENVKISRGIWVENQAFS